MEQEPIHSQSVGITDSSIIFGYGRGDKKGN